MTIELPTDDESSEDDSEFDGRIDLYEKYWLYVDCVRYTGPVLRRSSATKESIESSPLSRHYNHFYDKKEELKEKCRDHQASLPEYKDQFEEPRGNVRKVPLTEFKELGIEWSEGDDPIWLPSEYDLPPVWEDNLSNMDKSEMQNLIRELRQERDELEQRLQQISLSLSNYLESRNTTESKEASESEMSCEGCGQVFDSKAAKNGHKGHCDQIPPRDGHGKSQSSISESSELEELAEQLPEVKEQQSAADCESISSENEIKNLNHLLSGNL